MDTTQHDLKILSICYYIMAGISGAYVLLIGAYLSFISAVLANIPLKGSGTKEIPQFIPGLVAMIGAVVVGLGVLSALLMAGAAWSLPKRRNYPVVMIAAIVNCLQIPFGTALSVFTFVVLNRPGVRDSFRGGFQVAPPSPYNPPPPLPPTGW